MNRKLMLSALVLGGLALGGTASAATPSAEMLANTCAGCHGTYGLSQGPASPTIAGISKSYFIDTMKEYKEGSRASTIMTRIAKGYSDEEIEAMAGYFSSQNYAGRKQSFDTNLAKRGYLLHDKYCGKCHEDGGRSSDDDAGLLAGQWIPYLEYTFSDYMSGAREMPKKMANKVKELQGDHGDDGIKMLLNYYASQGE